MLGASRPIVKLYRRKIFRRQCKFSWLGTENEICNSLNRDKREILGVGYLLGSGPLFSENPSILWKYNQEMRKFSTFSWFIIPQYYWFDSEIFLRPCFCFRVFCWVQRAIDLVSVELAKFMYNTGLSILRNLRVTMWTWVLEHWSSCSSFDSLLYQSFSWYFNRYLSKEIVQSFLIPSSELRAFIDNVK